MSVGLSEREREMFYRGMEYERAIIYIQSAVTHIIVDARILESQRKIIIKAYRKAKAMSTKLSLGDDERLETVVGTYDLTHREILSYLIADGEVDPWKENEERSKLPEERK